MTKTNRIHRHGDHRKGSIGALATLVAMVCFFLGPCSAFTPDVNHRAIAGLWKLKQTPTSSAPTFPLKEFTVYPKRATKRTEDGKSSREVLLMLKEDGSFQQYNDQEQKVPDKLRFIDSEKTKASDGAVLDRYCEFGKLQGKWELVGGKLILAADRPMGENGKTPSMGKTSEEITDTILEGEVVATTEEGLSENPVLGEESRPEKESETRSDSRGIITETIVDTHLSVPNGQVNVGRFTYPQHHPSFFEAPMFNPKARGKFELKQVLGTLNTQQQSDQVLEEKFSVSDFYNKTFLLTSHPIPAYQPKGNIRWSIKYNKFVEDPPKKSRKKEDEEDKPTAGIRVLEVKFFQNNTFATIGGMGGDAILRGKFSVIGKEKDHIWMQIIRFGFGRSVSGSVFSEGKSLTKDDEKAYWGKIDYEDEAETKDEESDPNSVKAESQVDEPDAEANTDRRLRVKGSVLFGYGLEPLPIGLFVLSETDSVDLEDDEDEDEDDLGGFDGDSFLVDNFFDADDAFQ